MSPRWNRRLLVAACLLTLAAIALMVWSLLDPGVISVMLAMSAGQGLGTMSLAIFVFVVLADLRRAKVIGAAAPPIDVEAPPATDAPDAPPSDPASDAPEERA